MAIVREKIFDFINKIDKKVIFIAAVIAFTIAYYINPLKNVGLNEWDRTFCSASMSGISIDLRIGNFYKLFLLYLPSIFISLTFLLLWLFKIRKSYKDSFLKISILLLCFTFVSYVSRYSIDSTEISKNPLMLCLLAFLIILTTIALIDQQQKFDFADITMFLVCFVVLIMSFNMLLKTEVLMTNIIIAGITLTVYAAVMLLTPMGNKIYALSKNFLFILMWLPVVCRVTLEGLYFFIEKGYNIQKYYTYIVGVALVFVFFAFIVTVIFRKKEKYFSELGYIGAITSITTISFFSYNYQYIWSYLNFSNVYELGNSAVAVDSVLYGKLPVIDYFSAHAIDDVWTRIIYCIIHNDINGILVDPYNGLKYILSYIILFFIVKNIFDENLSVLYVILFPGMLIGIKWVSLCSISVVMLIWIFKRPKIKTYICFWIIVLLSAFITYDEGISLGIASIVAYVIVLLIHREWKRLFKFIACGGGVGVAALCFYIIYAVITGVPIISRILEWISVSAGSNSSWATANFGDQSSFAFLVSYFIVPITAISLLVFTLIKYYKIRQNTVVVLLLTVYALTEILYITRSIVYHNLYVCSGQTGVLLNFIHWTVSFFVLYIVSFGKHKENYKLLAWTGSMILVILLEGTVVTHKWPSADSSLLSKGLKASEKWDLQDDNVENVGENRIVFDEKSTELINKFKYVFDVLLSEDETFVDFANITSMYALTGRKRPCYVSQSPSLLTNLYSQQCFLTEISEYSCPLAVLGTTETQYLQQMIGIPHNIRYFKIAEYIYNNYRPLVGFGEFAIWCQKDKYDTFKSILQTDVLVGNEYELIDYGYDFTTFHVDENRNIQYSFKPYHSYDLGMIPYIWANHDNYDAIENKELLYLEPSRTNCYIFEGSQSVVTEKGNYLVFELKNSTEEEQKINIVFYDSVNDGAKVQYYISVVPGTNQYIIRVSADYFWDIFNVDTILFGSNEKLTVGKVRILEGD